MRVVIWVREGTSEGCVEAARALIPADANVTLLHVSPSDVEDLAAHGAARLLGRQHRRPPGPPLREVAAEEAQALLERARARLGRPAQFELRRGRVEREVVAA
ncbi:MAG: hypothetical protein JOZ64_07180, partial [Solirubrobacterales bacterium]|nr:hypothetical protein [Solirubrobacterales bacterium]